MSKLANYPIELPTEVAIKHEQDALMMSSGNKKLSIAVHECIDYGIDGQVVRLKAKNEDKLTKALLGTTAALIKNHIKGLTQGHERRLTLKGVGYRAKLSGSKIELTLGFSHPVFYIAPEGVQVEVPSSTEIVIKGHDKQVVGQVAADIRSFRPPEAYKGKGVRYHDEVVQTKEVKK